MKIFLETKFSSPHHTPMPKSAHSVECPCGGRYTPNNKSTHMKTKKHQAHVSSKVKTIRKRKEVDCDWCNRILGYPLGTIRSEHLESCDGSIGY